MKVGYISNSYIALPCGLLPCARANKQTIDQAFDLALVVASPETLPALLRRSDDDVHAHSSATHTPWDVYAI